VLLPIASGFALDTGAIGGPCGSGSRDWHPGACAPIFPAMSFLRTLSPLRAYRDLRLFLSQRKPHELIFLVLAIAITWVVMFAIASNSVVEKAYRPNIVYVEQWSANRTDAEIIAQQKIDGPKEKATAEAIKQQQAETQAAYKRLDDKLKKYGF
jgi:hypothetical protein